MGRSIPLIDRMADKYEVTDTGCFQWTAASNRYGRIKINGRMALAHRAMWELLVGPIPDGLHIDHLCKNTLCVNPDHLEPVTPRENLMRSPTKQRENAMKTHCLRGHPLSGENLYRDPRGMRQCRECARERSRRFELTRRRR